MDEGNLDAVMEQFSGGSFGFSGTTLDQLKATKYTLAVICVDYSSSLTGFGGELTLMLQNIIKALKDDPNANNMLVRVILFNHDLQELHGFKLLKHIDENQDYPIIRPTGATALIDVTYSGLESLFHYADTLDQNEYDTNGIIAVVTDGDDTASGMSMGEIPKLLDRELKKEKMESINRFLIGMNTQVCGSYLTMFQQDAQFTQYIDMGDASPDNIKKICLGISSSISSQSQALGTGQASAAPTTF